MGRLKLLILGISVAVPLLGVASVAYAQSFRTGNDISIARGEVVDKTVFASGQTVDISGTVNGDIFCAGQSISISGTVNGDVLCAGQNVRVSGHVNGSIRVAGQNVTVDGLVERNISAVGQSITLESSAKAKQDVSLAGQSIAVNGTVGRDLALTTASATINGTVGRDVQAQDTNLALGSSAVVGGDIAYTSLHTLSRASGAQVAGNITRSEPVRARHNEARWGAIIGGSLWFAVYLFIALLCMALLLALLFPRMFQAVSGIAINEPLKTVLVGFAISIIVPMLIIVFMFTVFGIPFALLVGLAWALAVCLAGPFAAYYAGRLILGKSANNVLFVMLIGAGVLLVLYFIPIVGIVVSLLALWFGLGMIVLQIPRLPRPRYALKSTNTK
jgi:cytoskeletal protein CcmA (bactofilin family)